MTSSTVNSDGGNIIGWNRVESDNRMFTQSGSTFTCQRDGIYSINFYANIITSSAGTTANNEFYRFTIHNPSTTVVCDALAARTTIWRANISFSRRFISGQTIIISAGVSAGLSAPINISNAELAISCII